jgi:hypothetical protein
VKDGHKVLTHGIDLTLIHSQLRTVLPLSNPLIPMQYPLYLHHLTTLLLPLGQLPHTKLHLRFLHGHGIEGASLLMVATEGDMEAVIIAMEEDMEATVATILVLVTDMVEVTIIVDMVGMVMATVMQTTISNPLI